MNKKIKQKIIDDLDLLLTTRDSGNRGLSDHMLFYLNVYTVIDGFRKSRSKILIKANELLKQYNSSNTTDLFSMIFFELYYNTLRIKSNYKLKGKCKVFTNIIHNENKTREFIKLYHNFGLFWAQHTNLVNPLIKKKCQEIDKDGKIFITLMNNLKNELYFNDSNISWTHNHYAYFSTLFFTQNEPNILKINKQKYTKYIRESLYLALQTKYSIDYIGECVEHLLRYNKSVRKNVIEYILYYEPHDKSYHYLVTGSIIPLCLFLKLH